jgi:hypothetical protein
MFKLAPHRSDSGPPADRPERVSVPEVDPVAPLAADLPKRLWIPLVCTLLPLLLVAVLAVHWQDKAATARQEPLLTAENRFQRSELGQRVTVGQALLVAVSRDQEAPTASRAGGRVFKAWAVGTVDERRPLDGDATMWKEWRDAAPLTASVEAANSSARVGLRWQSESVNGEPVKVWVSVAGTDGRTWVAELAPRYLWSSLQSSQGGFAHCVSDSDQRKLYCPPVATETTSVNPLTQKHRVHFPLQEGNRHWFVQTQELRFDWRDQLVGGWWPDARLVVAFSPLAGQSLASGR